MKQTILDHLFVTRGPERDVVVYEVYGDLRIRTYREPENPRTEKQQKNRMLYGLMNRISRQVKPLREFYFSRFPSYSNTHNAFISIQKMWLASLSDQPEQEIIKELLWSIGDLKFPSRVTLERKEKATLKWGFPEEQKRKVEKRQQTMWIVYNCKNSAWTWRFEAAGKTEERCELEIPGDWMDDEWYVWLFFYDPVKKKYSRSYVIHIQEGESYAHQDFPERQVSHQSIRENKIMHHWLESRKYTGSKRKQYLKDFEEEMAWRPWRK